MRLSILLAGCVLASSVASAQSARGFGPGSYAFAPRTAAYDPQFDAWHIQVVADTFRVVDPSGALFLASLGKMSGDTLVWTDIQGPCTGVVSRYKLGRDSSGLKLDLVDDQCTDRAAAVPNIYFKLSARSGDSAALERPRRYERLAVFGRNY